MLEGTFESSTATRSLVSLTLLYYLCVHTLYRLYPFSNFKNVLCVYLPSATMFQT